MAVFELQRVELLSELEDQYIDNSAVLDVIYELSTGSYFSDLHSPSFLLDMDSHLRLLTSALRLYKFHGKSLDQQICQLIYRGIQGLLSTNVAFRHSQKMFEALQNKGYEIEFVSHASAILEVDFPDAAAELEEVILNQSIPIEEIIRSGGGETNNSRDSSTESRSKMEST